MAAFDWLLLGPAHSDGQASPFFFPLSTKDDEPRSPDLWCRCECVAQQRGSVLANGPPHDGEWPLSVFSLLSEIERLIINR